MKRVFVAGFSQTCLKGSGVVWRDVGVGNDGDTACEPGLFDKRASFGEEAALDEDVVRAGAELNSDCGHAGRVT